MAEYELNANEYEARVKTLREGFVERGLIVECLYSAGGDLCRPNCPMFGNCWLESPLEKRVELTGVENT